jgi:hypothetical protein
MKAIYYSSKDLHVSNNMTMAVSPKELRYYKWECGSQKKLISTIKIDLPSITQPVLLIMN